MSGQGTHRFSAAVLHCSVHKFSFLHPPGLQRVEIKTQKTKFWRHQRDKPETYLATIEAIYYFITEYHDLFLRSEHLGQYDNLLFFFCFMYEKIKHLYDGGKKLKAYNKSWPSPVQIKPTRSFLVVITYAWSEGRQSRTDLITSAQIRRQEHCHWCLLIRSTTRPPYQDSSGPRRSTRPNNPVSYRIDTPLPTFCERITKQPGSWSWPRFGRWTKSVELNRTFSVLHFFLCFSSVTEGMESCAEFDTWIKLHGTFSRRDLQEYQHKFVIRAWRAKHFILTNRNGHDNSWNVQWCKKLRRCWSAHFVWDSTSNLPNPMSSSDSSSDSSFFSSFFSSAHQITKVNSVLYYV